MLDLRNVCDNFDAVKAALQRRVPAAEWDQSDLAKALSQVAGLAAERKEAIHAAQVAQEARNRGSERISKATPDERKALLADPEFQAEQARLKGALPELEAKQKNVEERIQALLLNLPNTPKAEVPTGASAEDNKEVRRWGTPRTFNFPVKPHYEIGEKLGILDFERAGKVSGSRFAFLRGHAAKMERALISFMVDHHNKAGDVELLPPYLVLESSMVGTGQLPKFAADSFAVPFGDGAPLRLIPTAEVPVTNYHRDEILEESALPIRYCAYSACFRSEAGAAGKDTRGLIRQHQFNKVEMVRFTRPEDSTAELERMTAQAEGILQALNLPYRTVALCSGDMGFGSAMTYDIEVWLPAQQTYREISSCSDFGDFQARRMDIKYRPAAKVDAKGKPTKEKPRLVHTLNGSGLAVGRTSVAILENYQEADGSVTIPEVLRPYMGGMEKISPP